MLSKKVVVLVAAETVALIFRSGQNRFRKLIWEDIPETVP
jgi:hypothetical protein